jgi:hypothetical protein
MNVILSSKRKNNLLLGGILPTPLLRFVDLVQKYV